MAAAKAMATTIARGGGKNIATEAAVTMMEAASMMAEAASMMTAVVAVE